MNFFSGMKNEVNFLIQNGFQESKGWRTILTEQQFEELERRNEKFRSQEFKVDLGKDLTKQEKSVICESHHWMLNNLIIQIFFENTFFYFLFFNQSSAFLLSLEGEI